MKGTRWRNYHLSKDKKRKAAAESTLKKRADFWRAWKAKKSGGRETPA